MDGDTALARHITYVHKHNRNPELGFTPYDPAFLKHYIAAARGFNPFVPPELSSHIVEAYVELRQQDGRGASSEVGDQAAMTARALLSILRVSQALAKLRFSDSVAVSPSDNLLWLCAGGKSCGARLAASALAPRLTPTLCPTRAFLSSRTWRRPSG